MPKPIRRKRKRKRPIRRAIRPFWEDKHCVIYNADCRDVLSRLEGITAVVTDPPYGLSFMGKDWDHSVPGKRFWELIASPCFPGAPLLSFGGTRTFHRLVCAIEDAGWEIRDCLQWIYGSGFPKSHNIGKAIDKRGGNADLTGQICKAIKEARVSRGLTVGQCDKKFCGGSTNWTWFEGRPAGQRLPTSRTFKRIAKAWPELQQYAELVAEAEREIKGQGRSGKTAIWNEEGNLGEYDLTAPATPQAQQWEGWGTALKPAFEPICLAMKPLEGTFAQNALKYGVGGLNVDGCRVEHGENLARSNKGKDVLSWGGTYGAGKNVQQQRKEQGLPVQGRWPANVIHDGSPEVLEGFPESKDGVAVGGKGQASSIYGTRLDKQAAGNQGYGGSGSAARFFYCAKASKKERGKDNKHPTVKPLALMRYLVRLVSMPEGTSILDPFMGSGSTLIAAQLEGHRAIGIDNDLEACKSTVKRLKALKGG